MSDYTMLNSWRKKHRKPHALRREGRGRELKGFRVQRMPEFLDQKAAPQTGRRPKHDPYGFNPLRAGGRFEIVSSPIETPTLSKVKSPFITHNPPLTTRNEAPQQAFKPDEYKVAADVLKVFGNSARENKSVQETTEADVLQELTQSLDNILSIPFAYRAFLAYAVNEYTDELVRFYKDTTDLAKYYKDLLPFRSAKWLYKQYIIAGAPHEINVSGKMKEDISQKLEEAAVNETYVDIAVFDAALFECRSLLEDQTFRRFTKALTEASDYALMVWSGNIQSIDDFTMDDKNSLAFYNLFTDIHDGLKKLKTLASGLVAKKQPHRHAVHRPIGSPQSKHYTYSNEFAPSTSLRFDEY